MVVFYKGLYSDVPFPNPKSAFFIAKTWEAGSFGLNELMGWFPRCQDGFLGDVSGPSCHQWPLGMRNLKSSLHRLKDREMTYFLNILFVDIQQLKIKVENLV